MCSCTDNKVLAIFNAFSDEDIQLYTQSKNMLIALFKIKEKLHTELHYENYDYVSIYDCLEKNFTFINNILQELNINIDI